MPTRTDIELETLIRARYPLIYVVSWEEKRVEDALRAIARERGKKLNIWTVTQGFATSTGQRDHTTREPLVALDNIANSPDQAIFLLKDFHAFITDFNVTRRLRDLTLALKNSFKNLVILAPILKLPPELEKEVTVLDYGLPTVDELGKLLDDIIRSVRDAPNVDTDLTPEEREQVLKAAQGLTAMEAENVFAKSLVQKRTFDVDVILTEKEQIIRKSGILEYYPADERFGDVGGLDILKDWMDKRTVAFSDKAREFGLPEPKGILLLGVQGCGKSLSAKAVGAQWRLPLLRLDVGKIFAGIVGSSEENMRKAIRVAESVAPCVPGDTRVTLADGSEQTIEALYESGTDALEVLAMTDDLQLRPVRVRAITRRPAPDLFTVRLKHAHLQATGNHQHPVLRDGELRWIRTDALRAGDYIAVPRRIPTAETYPRVVDLLPPETRLYSDDALEYARAEVNTPQRRYAARTRGATYVKIQELADLSRYPSLTQLHKVVLGRGGTTDSVLHRLPPSLNEAIGYLLGLISSDGYLGKRSGIGFVNTDPMLHRRFAEILHNEFGVVPVTRLNDFPSKTSCLPGTTDASVFRPCYATHANNLLLNRVLRNVNARLLSMPASFLRAWVRGYFDGDGYIAASDAKDPKVVLTSKRTPENLRVRSVLHRVGFLATNPRSANIEITGYANVRRFIAEIGSDHPCRKMRMEEWLRRPVTSEPKDRTDVIPVGELLLRARKSVGVMSHHVESATSSLINYYERNHGHPSRERLKRITAELVRVASERGGNTQELQCLQQLVKSPVGWSRVESVTPADPPEYVYDLACDGPHTFIANGVVTHNCVLWLDELEKGFSGTASSGSTDGGTTSRVFSTFLTWLQEKTVPVFVVATANQVESLPPELLRKGRFDEIFFIDLPGKAEREEIFRIHIGKRKRDPAKFDLNALAEATPGFSGAEIEQAVVEALYDAFDVGTDLTTEMVLKAVRATVPLSMTMREKIAYMREWAETRARKASTAPPETLEEQLASFLTARAEMAKAAELEKARKETEARKAQPDGDGGREKPAGKPRRIAVKKREGEAAAE